MDQPVVHKLSPKRNLSRQHILQAALQLFVEQGYHGTSMRQVASTAGIALGAIYNHFSGKEDIFKAVFLENHPAYELLPVLEDIDGETPEHFVKNLARRMVKALQKRPDFLNLMFIEVVEFHSKHTQELYLANLPQAVAMVSRIIAERGERFRTIPPLMMVRSFIGLFFSYYLTSIILQPDEPLQPGSQEDAMDQYVDIYLHGILQGEPQ